MDYEQEFIDDLYPLREQLEAVLCKWITRTGDIPCRVVAMNMSSGADVLVKFGYTAASHSMALRALQEKKVSEAEWLEAVKAATANIVANGWAPSLVHPPGLSAVAPSGHTYMYENYLEEKRMQGTGRFDYVRYDEQAMKTQAVLKEKHAELEKLIGELPPGRGQSLALTKLEECYMWVGKAIRDDQVKRNGSAPLQEERSSE